MKLSPGTPATAIQLAGGAPLNTRGSCAPIAAETAAIDANAKREISVLFASPPASRFPNYFAKSLTALANARTLAVSLDALASVSSLAASVLSALRRWLAELPSAVVSDCLTAEILAGARPFDRSS